MPARGGTLVALIRQRMQDIGYSQQDVADAVGVSQSTISLYLGTRTQPTPDFSARAWAWLAQRSWWLPGMGRGTRVTLGSSCSVSCQEDGRWYPARVSHISRTCATVTYPTTEESAHWAVIRETVLRCCGFSVSGVSSPCTCLQSPPRVLMPRTLLQTPRFHESTEQLGRKDFVRRVRQLVGPRGKAPGAPSPSKPGARAKLKALFDGFDEDESGLLGHDEVGDLLAELGLPLGDEALQEAIAAMKLDGRQDDDTVTYPELRAWWVSKERSILSCEEIERLRASYSAKARAAYQALIKARAAVLQRWRDMHVASGGACPDLRLLHTHPTL